MTKRRLLLLFLSYLAYFVFFIVFVLLSKLFFEEKPKSIYFGAFISILSYATIIFTLVKTLKLKIREKINLNARTIIFLCLLAISLILIYPITIPVSFAENLKNDVLKITNFKPLVNLLTANSLFYLAVVVIVNPILEELFFRKIMLSEINKKYGAFWAIFISSLLFAIIHLEINQLQSSFFYGFIFGYIYLKTSNLAITILLHILFNLGVYITIDSTVILSFQYYYLLLYPIFAVVIYFLIKQIVKINPKEILQN